jgi:hypothetical protein
LTITIGKRPTTGETGGVGGFGGGVGGGGDGRGRTPDVQIVVRFTSDKIFFSSHMKDP